MTGCGGSSRVSDDLLAGGALSRAGRGIVLMRVGMAMQGCQAANVGLAQADGAEFKFVKALITTSQLPVSEGDLAPGEYHVVSYTCFVGNTRATLSEPAGFQRFKRSYASFRIDKGEVVNVGYLDLAQGPVQMAVGPIDVSLAVRDWPVAELEKFKVARPKLYSQMKTRLMTVTPPPRLQPLGKEDCAKLVALRKDGKLQTLPAICGAG